jgi:hypothetical protein
MTTEDRPSARRAPRAAPGVLALLLPLLAGCGGGATVSGTVTYEGAPVDEGFITFYPADDRGPTRGAEIVEGRYHLTGLAPGRKRVLIATRPRGRKVPAARGRPQVRLVPPENAVPANATGNNQVLEVASGEQTLDFHLRRPKR